MIRVSCKTLFLFLLLSLSFCWYDYYIIGSSHHSFSPTVYSVSVKKYWTWKEESSKPFLDLPLIIELIFLFTFLSMFLSSPLIICVWHGTMLSLEFSKSIRLRSKHIQVGHKSRRKYDINSDHSQTFVFDNNPFPI